MGDPIIGDQSLQGGDAVTKRLSHQGRHTGPRDAITTRVRARTHPRRDSQIEDVRQMGRVERGGGDRRSRLIPVRHTPPVHVRTTRRSRFNAAGAARYDGPRWGLRFLRRQQGDQLVRQVGLVLQTLATPFPSVGSWLSETPWALSTTSHPPLTRRSFLTSYRDVDFVLRFLPRSVPIFRVTPGGWWVRVGPLGPAAQPKVW